MAFFTNAQNTVISAHTVTMNAYSSYQASDRVYNVICEGFDILCQNTTPSAFYGSTTSESGKDIGCLHGTRLDVQNHVFKWLNNPDGEVAMWMYGPAGIGKTAIAQTIAKLCAEREQLSSAFLFFRSDDGRNSAKNLVPTLAFEMLQQMPHTRNVVCTPIANNPYIFSTALDRQLWTVILPAISEPVPPSHTVTPPRPMLFIIDRLDECTNTGAQKSIIRSFILLLATTTTAVRHKILIVSRPESHIVSSFSAVDIMRHVNHLCLDEWKSINDIEMFLRAELEAIKQTHPSKSYLDAVWPSAESFRRLLDKSFESFAYATAAIRYISSHDRHPETSLQSLLGLNPHHAYEAHAELDTLYRHILESLDEKTRDIVLMLLCMHSWDIPTRKKDISTFGLIIGEEIIPVELALIKMSSVIRFERHERKCSYYHTSFSDFLLDEKRSGALYLYSPRIATAVATALLSRLFIPPETIVGAEHELSGHMVKKYFTLAADMQTHLLNAFLATTLPPVFHAWFFEEFAVNLRAGAQHPPGRHPAAIQLLYCQAFEHVATWLRSQFGLVPNRLEAMLNICFMPSLRSQYDAVGPARILFSVVRKSEDPWWVICKLLPEDQTWKLCTTMVQIYLAMPPGARSQDMQEYLESAKTNPSPSQWDQDKSMSAMLVGILQSEPARAEICHVLE